MNILFPVVYFLLFLSIPASYLSVVPNRVLLLILAFPAIRSLPEGTWKTIGLKLLAAAVGVLLLLLFGNNYIVKEVLLFLTLPIYWFILSKGPVAIDKIPAIFSRAACMTFLIMLLIKITDIISIGSAFFDQEHWWNQLLYKQLSATIDAHPAYLSLFFMVGLIFALNRSLGDSKRQHSFVQVIVLCTAILLLAVKTFLLILVTVLLIFTAVAFHKRILIASIVGGLLLVILSTSAAILPGIKHRLLKTFTTTETLDMTDRVSERKALWRASLETMNEHPLIGSTLRGLSSRDAIHDKTLKYYPHLEFPKNAHNNFLEAGVRYGYPGCILFIVLLMGLLFANFRQPEFALASITITMAFFSMTESFLFREVGLSVIAILIVIFGKHGYGKRI